MLDIYPASEKPIKGINSDAIVQSLKQMGHKNCHLVKNHQDVNNFIEKNYMNFDIFITQGAGSIAGVCDLITDKWKV